MMSNDLINHPAHYTSCPSGIECIEITELLPFCLGNCYKYLHRAGLKGDELTDLQKAVFYARRAYLNDEKLTETAQSLIFKVARHQADEKRKILSCFAAAHIKTFYLFLQEHVSKYEQKRNTNMDNRST